MNKQEFDKQIENIKAIQQAKNSLENLTINWETDIEKMNFQALRSSTRLDLNDEFQEVWIDKMDITCQWQEIESSQLEKDFFGDKATIELINFIVQGDNKIIPPMNMQHLEFCGETSTTRSISDITQVDGAHRIFVSKRIGLNEIPTINIKRVTKFTFPLTKWEFDFIDGYFIAQSKLTEAQIKLNAENLHISSYGGFGISLVINR